MKAITKGCDYHYVKNYSVVKYCVVKYSLLKYSAVRSYLLLIITALCLDSICCATTTLCQSKDPWTKSANGLEYKKIGLPHAASMNKQLIVARIIQGKQGIRVLRAQDFGKKSMSAKEICAASGAILCINSSFFDEKNNALGLLVSSGITFQRPHLTGDTLTGIFAATRKSFAILGRDEFNSALFIEAVQAGPRLIKAGKLPGEFKDRESSRRSGVCIDVSGTPIFFITTDDSWAITLSEFAKTMASEECVDGLNLDGGGSAQFFMRGSSGKNASPEETTFDIRGQDEAPVFLAVMEGLSF